MKYPSERAPANETSGTGQTAPDRSALRPPSSAPSPRPSALGPRSSVLGPSSLTLVRHGETTGQSSIRYYGRTDVELSELGIRQMERVRSLLACERFDAVYSSPLRRAVSAARIVSPDVEPASVEGFSEIDFGHWEGLTREEIEARDPDLYRRWRSAVGDFEYPGGDSAPSFRRKVVSALHELLPSAPPRVLIVAHRGVIGAIIAELLGLNHEQRTEIAIDLASVHVLDSGPSGWTAARLDVVEHLEGLS